MEEQKHDFCSFRSVCFGIFSVTIGDCSKSKKLIEIDHETVIKILPKYYQKQSPRGVL